MVDRRDLYLAEFLIVSIGIMILGTLSVGAHEAGLEQTAELATDVVLLISVVGILFIPPLRLTVENSLTRVGKAIMERAKASGGS